MQESYQILYVRSSWFQRQFKWHLKTGNISDIYVIRLCIYNMSIETSNSVSNIQHSMLDLHTGNTASPKNKSQGILLTFLLAYLAILYSFGA